MSVISNKNQITIPAVALRAAGLGPGDDVPVVPAGTLRRGWLYREQHLHRGHNAG